MIKALGLAETTSASAVRKEIAKPGPWPGTVSVALIGKHSDGRRAILDAADLKRLEEAFGLVPPFNFDGKKVVRCVKRHVRSKKVTIAREIAGAGKGKQARPIDGDPLNLTKANLQVVDGPSEVCDEGYPGGRRPEAADDGSCSETGARAAQTSIAEDTRAAEGRDRGCGAMNLEGSLEDEGFGEGVSAHSSSSNLNDTAAGHDRVTLPFAKTHRAFEAATAEGRAFVLKVTDMMAAHESRARALKKADARTREVIVATLLGELLRSTHGVQVALSSLGTEPKRYRVAAWSSGTLPKVLDLMHAAGLLEVTRGGWGVTDDPPERAKTATVLQATAELLALVQEVGLKASDGVGEFQPLPPPEVISLALSKSDRRAIAKTLGKTGKAGRAGVPAGVLKGVARRRILVDHETAETRAMRKDVETVNAWLRRGDLAGR